MTFWSKSFAGLVLVLCGWGELRAVAQMTVSERYLFSTANAERSQRGLPLLRWDAALYRAADAHAQEMAARGSISHQYAGEAALAERGRSAGARFSVIAENVAEAPTAARIHDAWMNSPGHRANLLDPQVDAVAIRVLSRAGQLYAVQDFERQVTEMTLDEQEGAVGDQMTAISQVNVVTGEDARKTCAMGTGYAGSRQPMFVMRYTSVDLSKMPEALKAKLTSGAYREAAVGACAVGGKQSFTTYSVAVMLYR